MITKTYIRRLANDASYNKGRQLFGKELVLEFEVDEADGTVDVEAAVKGSGHNIYDITLSYDLEDDEIDHIRCDCPAFSSYSGICKHCVAVLLELEDYQKHMPILDMLTNRSEEDSVWDSPWSENLMKMPQKLQTTPIFKNLLLRSSTNQVPEPVFMELFQEPVRLEPHLRCWGTRIDLEFKIGNSRMYVLQNMVEFCRAMQHGKHVYYGKQLAFVHEYRNFDKPSRDYIEYMMRGIETRLSMSNYYPYSSGDVRSLSLVPEELDDFLDTVGTEGVRMDFYGEGERVWYLTDKALPREMTITGVADGIEIRINILQGYVGRNHYIYFLEGEIYRVAIRTLEPIKEFLNCMGGIPDRTIFVEKSDVSFFCRNMLPVLKEHYHVEKKDFDEETYGLVEPVFEFYLDAPDRDTITCKIVVKYGEDTFNLYHVSAQMQMRDHLQEKHVNEAVSPYFNTLEESSDMLAIYNDEGKVYEALTEGIDVMRGHGDVFISETLKRINIVRKTKVAVGVSVESGLMSVTLDTDQLTREELVEILSKYNPKKKYYRLSNGDFVQVQDDELEMLYELKQVLHLTDVQLKKETLSIPKYRALFIDELFKEDRSVTVSRDKGFRSLIRNMKTIEDNDYEVPESLSNTLREYQKTGFLWMKTLKTNGFGGILADDMGLGKTLQVISFMLSEIHETDCGQKMLIVCPASLVYNWKAEFEKFAPQLQTTMVVGTAYERRGIIGACNEGTILITSYDLLKRDIEHYQGHTFACQVIDEAQAIKNQNTQVAKAVKLIAADFKLALTGTPIENRLSELWSIFDYLMPGFLFGYTRFKKEIEGPIVQNNDEVAMKRLQKMITPFILRRLKKDVLADLPEKIEENMPVVMASEQRKLYDAHVQKIKLMLAKQSDSEFTQSKLQILSELTRLRQLCCDPSLVYDDYRESASKVEASMELIHEAVESGHKILVFSQFTTMLDIIRTRLEQEAISYHYLSGATSKHKRAEMVDLFNQDTSSVFCISLKAGGTGLNLTAADIVIHVDPWWNVAVQNQATDRAHRIGQTNVVNVYRLIAQGTIEEKIVALQEKKQALADEILSGEGLGVGRLSKEELMALLE